MLLFNKQNEHFVKSKMIPKTLQRIPYNPESSKNEKELYEIASREFFVQFLFREKRD